MLCQTLHILRIEAAPMRLYERLIKCKSISLLCSSIGQYAKEWPSIEDCACLLMWDSSYSNGLQQRSACSLHYRLWPNTETAHHHRLAKIRWKACSRRLQRQRLHAYFVFILFCLKNKNDKWLHSIWCHMFDTFGRIKTHFWQLLYKYHLPIQTASVKHPVIVSCVVAVRRIY